MSIVLPDEKTITQNKITLEKIRKGVAVQIGYTSLESMDFTMMEDMIRGKIIQASFDVLASKIHEDRTTVYFHYKTPLNWVEHLKKDKAPKWLLNRYPVKYRTHNIKRVAVFKRYAEYPKANIAIPKTSTVFIEALGGLEVIHDVVSV